MVIEKYFVCFEHELLRAQAMLSLSLLMKNQKQLAHSRNILDTFATSAGHIYDVTHKDRQCQRSCLHDFQTLISLIKTGSAQGHVFVTFKC